MHGLELMRVVRRSPHGSADRNVTDPSTSDRCTSRSPHGSADRNNCYLDAISARQLSLPARERGSKRREVPVSAHGYRSLPARERGSKRLGRLRHVLRLLVAPRTGARIETRRPCAGFWWDPVAPRTGARIETRPVILSSTVTHRRSPHGSADRNMSTPPRVPHDAPSLPARERGSKLFEVFTAVVYSMSLPARERGSKPRPRLQPELRLVAPRTGARIETTRLGCARHVLRVAPRTGARIETCRLRRVLRMTPVAPRTGARIETPKSARSHLDPCVAPRTGARIETALRSRATAHLPRRSPHGSADRNQPPRSNAYRDTAVAPRTGARIETPCSSTARTCFTCRSPHGSADRNSLSSLAL